MISPLSTRAITIKDSITMAVTDLANQLKKQGLPIISFTAGEPDFDTPNAIKDAAKIALDQGKTKYTAASGIPELKTAIVQKLKTDQGLTYTPSQIVVSCGAKHSIYNTLLALINPGDEVIVPAPYWVSYPDQIDLVGGVPVIIQASDATQFKITPTQLKNALTPKTKLIILNSPSNPTGTIYTRDELLALGDVILSHPTLHILSDEIYEHLTYDTHTHVSIASLSPQLAQRTIIVNGLSKAYAMTGWRIGYTASTTEIAVAMGKIQSQTTSNPTSIAQYASIQALTGPQTEVEEMKKSFQTRRNLMISELKKIPLITCLTPPGAFYTFPNISALYGKTSPQGLINNDLDFCAHLLHLHQVACVPGSGFGAPHHIRLTYTLPPKDITEGIQKIAQFVSTLK